MTAPAKPAYYDIYINLVRDVEQLTDKLQQDLEDRLRRLDRKNKAVQPSGPDPAQPKPPVVPPQSVRTPTPVDSPVDQPEDEEKPSGIGTNPAVQSPATNTSTTRDGNAWWSKVPTWRGMRGVFRWLWYGHHRDNPDYHPYMNDWVDTFSKDRLKLSEFMQMEEKAVDIADQFTTALCHEFIEASLSDLPDLYSLIDGFKGAMKRLVFRAIKQTYELNKSAAVGPEIKNDDDVVDNAAGKPPVGKPPVISPTPKDEPSPGPLQPTLSPQDPSELPSDPPVRKRGGRRKKAADVVPPVAAPGDEKPDVKQPPMGDGEDAGREVPGPTQPVPNEDEAAVLYGTKKLAAEELEGMKLNWDQRGEMLKTIESKMSGSRKTPLQQRKHKEWKEGKAGKEKAYQYLKSKDLIPTEADDLKNINANARLRNYIEAIFHVTPKAAESLMAYIKTRESHSDLPIGGTHVNKSEQEIDSEVDDMLSRLGDHVVWNSFNRSLYEEMTADEKKNYLLDLMRKGNRDTFIPRMKVDSMKWNEKIAFYKDLLRA